MKIIKKNNTYFLNFNNKNESDYLDNYTGKELEIKIINEDVLVFLNKDKNTPFLGQTVATTPPLVKNSISSKDLVKKKIISILQDKDLSFKERVEGNFEDLLKKEDLEIFKEMLKDKEIITFKQSEKYKKAIYVVNEKYNPVAVENKPVLENKQPFENKSIQETKVKVLGNTTEENADLIIKEFIKKKYVIIKTQSAADKFSKEFYIKFKNNEIKGMKSFEGSFYVIDVKLYEKTRERILSSNFQKNFSIEELSEKLNYEIELLRIAIEFIKEEGLIIEKKKNIYCLI